MELRPFVGCVLFISLISHHTTRAENHTNDCLARAAQSSCEVFHSCCHFRCRTAGKKRAACNLTQPGGYINTREAECYCSSIPQAPQPPGGLKRFSKLDLIAGILLIFVVDLLFLSFVF
ncbi:unnamed protein product, partial [Mesorhabditis spiculigera]